MTLRVENLRFSYPGHNPCLVIDELKIDQSSFVFGPSGCGKSTLLSILSGMHKPQSGQVWIDETSLFTLSAPERDRWRGQKMGFIFQSFNLISYLSVYDNVVLPCRIHHGSISKDFKDRADFLLDKLDMGDMASQKARALSVGQQQRVAIARSLVMKPRLILADEPTSALDEDRQEAFLDLLLRQSSDVGAVVVFVSHDQRLSRHFPVSLDLRSINQVNL